ncbi:hypothetical protein [Pantoea sp. CFSAN033090]|uniref:hypothetical protein n=1 Tax=Pantoea sp. CFSAN033090 TaxID=1690502 RepID=UPI00068B5385|nr:hypothetical protein [Pantoea sp. CFSAN033090]
MSSRNDGGGILIVCFVVVIMGALGISHLFDVPFTVGVKIVPFLVFLCIATGAAWWFDFLNWTWPLFLGGLWVCFLPIVDYKAGITGDDFPLMPYVEWYGHGFWQAVIFTVIVLAGYAIAKWRDHF